MNNTNSAFDSTDTNLYKVSDLQLFPAGDNLVLAYTRNSQIARFIRMEMADLLTHCNEFRTISDHVQTYYGGQQISPASIRVMRRELQHLAQSGYFVSLDSIRDIFLGSNEQNSPTHIASIGFPTCDRVETLQRGMTSWIKYCQKFERTNEFVVVDDSASLETRKACQNMLKKLKLRYNEQIAYAGVEEKLEFVKRLAAVGNIPLDIVSFACLGDKQDGITTVGANRNVLLLHTAGDIIFSSDDDILFQSATAPDMRDEIVLGSHGNPLDVWFFSDREDALQSTHFVEQDLLALHERWLGKDPVSCEEIYGSSHKLSFEQVDVSLFNKLSTSSGKVALTLNGTVGDCSWDNPHYYLFQYGETFNRLTNSEQTYRSARSSREMAQAVKQVTLTEKADPLFSMCIGLDNRELLPPFTPIGRAEDVAFGAILSKCFTATYAVHLPWLLLHAPSEVRSFSKQHMFSIGFNAWIPYCINLFDPGFARTPTERLRKLGQYLEEIGNLSPSSFEEFARLQMWNSMTALISGLEERLQMTKGVPAYWTKDVKAFITQVRQNALTPVNQLYTLRGGREETQKLLVRFGQLLEWWPAMVETARRLRMEGLRLAQPI